MKTWHKWALGTAVLGGGLYLATRRNGDDTCYWVNLPELPGHTAAPPRMRATTAITPGLGEKTCTTPAEIVERLETYAMHFDHFLEPVVRSGKSPIGPLPYRKGLWSKSGLERMIGAVLKSRGKKQALLGKYFTAAKPHKGREVTGEIKINNITYNFYRGGVWTQQDRAGWRLAIAIFFKMNLDGHEKIKVG